MSRSAEQLATAVDEIRAAGGRALALAGDVTKQADIDRVVATVTAEFGPLDLLVNNAGSLVAIGPLWESDPEVWWRDVEVNLRGTYLFCRAVVPAMVSTRSGRVINVSSYAGTKTSPFHTAYAASKAAIIRLTEGLAQSLQEHRRVRVRHQPRQRTDDVMTDAMMASPASAGWFPGLWRRASRASGKAPTRRHNWSSRFPRAQPTHWPDGSSTTTTTSTISSAARRRSASATS